MSIQSQCFDLAKIVKHSEIYTPLRDVIFALNHSPANGRDRSMLGANARKQNLQALGYLLLDANKDKFPFRLPSLEVEEKRLLNIFHSELLKINNACIHTLKERFETGYEVAEPYYLYKYEVPNETDSGPVFSEEAVTLIAKEFLSHPGIKQAIDYMPTMSLSDKKEEYIKWIMTFMDRLQVNGVHNVPNEIAKDILNPTADTRVLFQRHIMGIVSIRASLQILDQTLFQVFSHAKLLMLDEKNVIKVRKHNSHLVGTGITLLCQPENTAFSVQPNDIVLIGKGVLNGPDNLLGWVNFVRFSMSEDYGHIMELSLWALDENLNPFAGLIV